MQSNSQAIIYLYEGIKIMFQIHVHFYTIQFVQKLLKYSEI